MPQTDSCNFFLKRKKLRAVITKLFLKNFQFLLHIKFGLDRGVNN